MSCIQDLYVSHSLYDYLLFLYLLVRWFLCKTVRCSVSALPPKCGTTIVHFLDSGVIIISGNSFACSNEHCLTSTLVIFLYWLCYSIAQLFSSWNGKVVNIHSANRYKLSNFMQLRLTAWVVCMCWSQCKSLICGEIKTWCSWISFLFSCLWLLL